ncbi:MAG: rhomboid-like protein [Segniliparus sp.]|uniref:rhomboid-like protein n=1 Tax=Segniliparus sp. TaxID=2804064 RepID=UPI003F2C8073
MPFSQATAPLRWAARFPVTLCYVLGLVAVALLQRGLSTPGEEQLVSSASTNLRNLADGRVQTLLESAFVTEEDPSRLWLWLPGLACLLALGELLWRSRRLAGTIVLGHVGGTAVVAVGLVVALRLGWVESSVVDDDDVGVSYAAMGVIGALVGAFPRRVRPAWAAWWLVVAAAFAWFNQDFTSVGHLVSLGLGLVAGAWLARGGAAQGRRLRWTPVPLGLAAGAFAFGVGVLVDEFDGQAATALLLGAAAAALAAGASAPSRRPG